MTPRKDFVERIAYQLDIKDDMKELRQISTLPLMF